MFNQKVVEIKKQIANLQEELKKAYDNPDISIEEAFLTFFPPDKSRVVYGDTSSSLVGPESIVVFDNDSYYVIHESDNIKEVFEFYYGMDLVQISRTFRVLVEKFFSEAYQEAKNYFLYQEAKNYFLSNKI